jgi:acyl-CoA synthetase (AMP-forming)/AMP-acid ligase II
VRALGKMLVGSVLKTSAARYAQREAICCVGTGRRITYGQLNERCNQLANALLSRSLPRGAVVAFLCSNRAEIIEMYFAIAKAGFVGLPLNYRLAPREVETLVNAMQASVLICDARFADTYDHLRSSSTSLQHVLWIGENAPSSCVAYEEFIAASSTAEPAVEVEEHDTFYYNLTSGTTGLPKSYALTQYNAVTLDSTVVGFDLRSDDVFLNVFPAFGRVGFGWSLIAVLMGARNVLMDFDVGPVLATIARERVTFTNLVPTMAALLLKHPALATSQLSTLRGIVFVGAMLPPTIRDQAMARLCPYLYEGYGLQETGFLTVSTPEDRAAKPDSVGRAVMFADVRVVDPQGREVAPGEIGEIIGRSPNGITGYFDNAVKNAEVFRNGWFYSGDLGRLDQDGHLYICGRVKDMVISGGQNVHAAEVEAVLLALPGVEDCAVFGLPDDTWGESVAAAIVVAADSRMTADDVQTACREQLAGFKLPRRVYFQHDPLPRTPTGKVQKFLLVERHSRQS